jgi:hypothetical protein
MKWPAGNGSIYALVKAEAEERFDDRADSVSLQFVARSIIAPSG